MGGVSGDVEHALNGVDERCPPSLKRLSNRTPNGAGSCGTKSFHERDDQEEPHDNEYDTHNPVSELLDAYRRDSCCQEEYDIDEQHPSDVEGHDPRCNTRGAERGNEEDEFGNPVLQRHRQHARDHGDDQEHDECTVDYHFNHTSSHVSKNDNRPDTHDLTTMYIIMQI